MEDCGTKVVRFETEIGLELEARFNGGRLTSEGGLPWLEEAERQLGLLAGMARCVPEWRGKRIVHSLETLVKQRVFQIACGYEDQDDADSLRSDPLLKVVCGRRLEAPDLASQPSLSRLENGMSRRGCVELGYAMLECYMRSREQEGIPECIRLDVDSTDDPTHGEQEGSAYHGYYEQHMYHPLLVFDGDTQQLITAILRPGNSHAGRGSVAILSRIVKVLRSRWPGVKIELRADAGFALPAVYTFCEQPHIAIEYVIGLIPNPRLESFAQPLLQQAQMQQAVLPQPQKVRLLDQVEYQADSWDNPRRVIIKAELLAKGPNTRFVVTNRKQTAHDVYELYIDRGEAENWIKDFKNACFATRLSCHRFLANQFRLFLHAAAYWLLHTIRSWLVKLNIPSVQLDTLRLRLIKIGGWVKASLGRLHLRLASSHPGENWWLALASSRGFVNNSG